MDELGRIRKIHFVGIGGVGMAGIAELLLTQGFHITGSDCNDNTLTKRLTDLGATVYKGHDPSYIGAADVVVASTAVPQDNIELKAARLRRIPVVPRAGMLAELMRFRYGVAVAGTHGKTTTTSLVSSILTEGGLDPTYVIGGRLVQKGSNAYLGKGKYLVAEADESDASFLFLNPMIAIVTNIDSDHLENYQHDFKNLKQAFVNFLHRLPFYGLAVVCIDDEVVSELLPAISRPVLTYGFSKNADYHIQSFKQDGYQSTIVVQQPNKKIVTLTINLPGKHNALNALAAAIVAKELGVSDEKVKESLLHFQGVGRRLQHYGDFKVNEGVVTLVDDYGHHPNEIKATIEAARQAWPERRLVLMFQPHRYTRMRDLLDDFAQELSHVDALILLNVYSAGEPKIVGADSRDLARTIRHRSKIEPIFVSKHTEIPHVLTHCLKENDVLLTMGAGSIGSIAYELADKSLDFDQVNFQ